MATPNSQLVLCPPIQTYFVDKDTGAPLSGGYVIFYEQNNQSVKKPVYQLAQLPNNTFVYNELSNPVMLGSTGTFVDENGTDISVYLFPYRGTPTNPTNTVDYYFLQVYSAGGVLQETRQYWPNYIVPNADPGSIGQETDNLITNPQFSSVNFTASGFTYSPTGSPTVTGVGPGWDLVTQGAGSVTLTQTASSLINVPSNPPYILTITNSGFAQPLQLRQRMYNSPRLFVGGYVSGYFVCASSSGSTTLSMELQYSNGTPLSFTVASVTTPSGGGYIDTSGVTSTIYANQTSPNPDSSATGYVDVIINIPVNTTIQLSSIQVCSVSSLGDRLVYFPTPVARNIDHTYNTAYPIVPVGSIIDFAGFTAPAHYLLCDGATYNRKTYNLLFTALTQVQTLTIAPGTAMTVVSSSKLFVGMFVEGAGIPANTTINVISGLSVTLSNAITVGGTVPVTFFKYGNGDGSATFNVPNFAGFIRAGSGGNLFAVTPSVDVAGTSGGSKTYTLLATDLPDHRHNPLTPLTSFEGRLNAPSAGHDAVTSGTTNTVVGTTGGITGFTTQTAFNLMQPTDIIDVYIRYE